MNQKVKSILTDSFISGSLVMLIGSNLVNFLNYLYHLLHGRLLGPAAYGELAALISLIGMLGIIPGSFGIVIIKFISSAKDQEEVSQLASWFIKRAVMMATLTVITTLLLSTLISSFLQISDIKLLWLVVLASCFYIPSFFIRSILQGLAKFTETITTFLIESSSKLIISVGLIMIGFSVLGATVGILISAFLGWYFAKRFLKGVIIPIDNPHVNTKKVYRFIFSVVIQTISLTSILTVDLMLVKHYFNPHDAGIYASLSTLGKIIFFGTGPIGAVMFPLTSKRFSKGQKYYSIFYLSLLATTLMSACLLIIYWQFPQIIINLLYGKLYLEGSQMLVLMGVFMFLYAISSLMISFYMSLGKTWVVVFPLIAGIIQILLIYLYHQDLYSVLYSNIISSSILTIMMFGVLIKEVIFTKQD